MEDKSKTAVEKKEGEAAATTPETGDGQVDYQAELATAEAELAKLRTERDNYRKGLLKAKGKLPDPVDESEPSLDERIEHQVRLAMLDEKESKINREKDALTRKLLQENHELKLAVANRNQIPVGGTGSSSETKLEPSGQFFSDAQLNDLKARGWNDKKIESLKALMVRKGVR